MTQAQQLGARIIAFRERLGLSQAELAVNSGVDPGLLAAVEAGEAYPAMGILIKLARALGQGKSDRHMEPLYIEIGPEEPAALTSHEGEEFLIALSGQLVIHYGKERHLLEPGDSAYYNSIVPHSVSAGGGQPASAYAVVYQPS